MQRNTRLAAFFMLATVGCTQIRDSQIPVDRSTPPPATAALIFVSNLHQDRTDAPRQVFALNLDGTGLTQLTRCEDPGVACDSIEAAPSADRVRMMIRRAVPGSDLARLVFVDLARGVEGELVLSSVGATGIDWSPTSDILVYSAAVAAGEPDDLFRVNWNGNDQIPLTLSTEVAERRARIDPTGSIAVFERIDPPTSGEIWVFQTSVQQSRVTTGRSGTERLDGTPYLVGSDADPCFSPDGRSIVFRRLTSTAIPGRGTWDVLTVSRDGTSQVTLASGPAYRGAPDWGPQGIVFAESDASETRLVVIQADGTGRRALLSRSVDTAIDNPRWLR